MKGEGREEGGGRMGRREEDVVIGGGGWCYFQFLENIKNLKIL